MPLVPRQPGTAVPPSGAPADARSMLVFERAVAIAALAVAILIAAAR
jgi:hypothetical protein